MNIKLNFIKHFFKQTGDLRATGVGGEHDAREDAVGGQEGGAGRTDGPHQRHQEVQEDHHHRVRDIFPFSISCKLNEK